MCDATAKNLKALRIKRRHFKRSFTQIDIYLAAFSSPHMFAPSSILNYRRNSIKKIRMNKRKRFIYDQKT